MRPAAYPGDAVTAPRRLLGLIPRTLDKMCHAPSGSHRTSDSDSDYGTSFRWSQQALLGRPRGLRTAEIRITSTASDETAVHGMQKVELAMAPPVISIVSPKLCRTER